MKVKKTGSNGFISLLLADGCKSVQEGAWSSDVKHMIA